MIWDAEKAEGADLSRTMHRGLSAPSAVSALSASRGFFLCVLCGSGFFGLVPAMPG